jgi:hypothetical protein
MFTYALRIAYGIHKNNTESEPQSPNIEIINYIYNNKLNFNVLNNNI